jgi:hypothetical protein
MNGLSGAVLEHPPNWDKFDAQRYGKHHYGTVSEADRRVALRVAANVRTILQVASPSRCRAPYERAVDVGGGGGLRTALLGGPLLRWGGEQVFTDIGQPQLDEAWWQVEQERKRPKVCTRIYARHETGLTDRGFRGLDRGYYEYVRSLRRITQNPVVRRLDILEESVGEAGIRTEGHCLCSITSDRDAHYQAVRNFYDGMEPGDTAIRLFDVNSTGYAVEGEEFPGYPTNAEEVARQAESMGLLVLDAFEVSFGQAPAIPGVTSSTFSALGAAVMIKEARYTPTIIA